jgi:hypothetical protein
MASQPFDGGLTEVKRRRATMLEIKIPMRRTAMHGLSSTHRSFDRSVGLTWQVACTAVAAARTTIARARTESVLRSLSDEQAEDAGLDRSSRRPQIAIDARLMSGLMSMR